jgi:4-amino-4-deoxy-L-arabinose transferase-like glycosyltransferase
MNSDHSEHIANPGRQGARASRPSRPDPTGAQPVHHVPASRLRLGWLALALGVFVYLHNLGSEHAATNPDEHLYWQITRMTAEGGEWLPLKNLKLSERNTKPPALFWQGLVMTDWGQHWELWRLRLPVALYSLATAALVLLVGRRLSGSTHTGILAALVFLAFFSTYRYGRVVLTSMPETFWFFLPFAILLTFASRQPAAESLSPQRDFPTKITWPLALAFGLMVGVGLLYKSFALVIPFCAGLTWWTLHQRGYRFTAWLRADAPKITLLGLIALGVFSLWFWLDPNPHLILQDFVLKENAGKFDPKRGNYFLNLVAGNYTIWRILFGYPFNAGLLAPAAVALAVIAFRGRRTLAEPDKLLWIWVLTQMIVFALPQQRDERYLLPAMPALAVLLALHWTQIPRWTFAITLAAAAAITTVFLLGGIILTGEFAAGPLYPWYFAPLLAAIVGLALAGLFRRAWTKALAAPAILLLYLAYALFTIPFDGPRGEYSPAAIEAVRGRTVVLPTVFGAHDEVYRFMLPGAEIETIRIEPPAQLDDLRPDHQLFILSVPASNTALAQFPGLRILGERFHLVDRFTGNQSKDMLRGNITGQLFQKDLLIEIVE